MQAIARVTGSYRIAIACIAGSYNPESTVGDRYTGDRAQSALLRVGGQVVMMSRSACRCSPAWRMCTAHSSMR